LYIIPVNATCIIIAPKKQLQNVPYGAAGFSETNYVHKLSGNPHKYLVITNIVDCWNCNFSGIY
jgi:hypothetical protein